jgi:hypothetical protein
MDRLFVSLALCCAAWCAPPEFCQPSQELRLAFERAAAVSLSVAGPFDAQQKIAPFQALRDRFPADLFVQERYQDAVQEYGIEGHLRLMTKHYQTLLLTRPSDPVYQYLFLRTQVGRNTLAAIQGLNELLADHPDFAPAHRTLAEIHRTEAFRDSEKEKSEARQFLAACSGGAFTRRPPPVPEPSALLDRAELLLAQNKGDPDQIIAMTIQGLKEFEWRSQRIRAFDWYSLEFKREDARQLRARYWTAWSIQVRAYRRAGRADDANRLLAIMEQRAARLRKEADASYQAAEEILAKLNLEGKQAQAKGGDSP